jgi:RNA polymerase sigma factor (sigma-70 family)
LRDEIGRMPQEPSRDRGALPAKLAEADASDPELLFDHLYESYEPMVERWVRRLAGPSAEVEDLIHDVFVVALRRRGEFRGEAKVSTWLFRITQFVVRKRRFRQRVRRFLDGLHRSEAAAVALPSPTPLELVEQRQRCARLYAALDRLPDKYRTAVVLCDIEGMAAEAAGQLLGLTANAVWVRVHRGRGMLLEQLTRHQGRAEV